MFDENTPTIGTEQGQTITGTNVRMVWNSETDSGDAEYKGYWIVSALDTNNRFVPYNFTIEIFDGNIVIKDQDVDYEFTDEELDDTLEALEMIRNMRNLMKNTLAKQ